MTVWSDGVTFALDRGHASFFLVEPAQMSRCKTVPMTQDTLPLVLQDDRARSKEETMRRILVVMCTVWSILGESHATAQSFPSRPVRYIMPLPAGQETDVFARVLARQLSDDWGQQVIVDNRPGGGTVIGTDLAAKAAPDGYTLMHAIAAHAINPTLYAKLPYDTLKDFACITQIGNLYGVLIAHPSFPAKNIKELIALAKVQPGKIVYATGPIGTSTHIAGEALRLAAGIDIVHVPYKGGGPAIQDLLPGRVPLVSTVVLEALPFIRSGKAKPIAVTGPKRSPSLPNVPTVGETLPAYQSGTAFWALLTRAGTTRAVVQQLNADVLRAMQTASVRERMAQTDVEPVGSTPAQCDAFLREQVKLWGGIVRASGAKVD
jgi:tripartite-type tricarboxylate transporter receptor subunit TctC